MSQETPKKRTNKGKAFQKGLDSRRNIAGRPPVDVAVAEIKGELKQALAMYFHKYFHLRGKELATALTDPNLNLGERIALRFLSETSNKGDPARVGLLARILGLEIAAPTIQIDVDATDKKHITMKDVMEAMKKDKLLEHKKEIDQCTDAIIVETKK